jgi:hypothetical protein
VRDDRFKYIRSWHPEQPGGHRLAFRDNQDGMRALWQLHEAGELDPVQRRWFEPVGREQLYDLRSDPHEIHDLAGDPAHHETLVRMRGALAAWLTRVGDTSEESEQLMVERFWPGGEQPLTALPTFRRADGRVALTSATPGASIGYRRDGEARWQLYTRPIELEARGQLEARAVRYGYAQSAVATLPSAD